MARTDTLGNFLTDVAEAIRTKKGTTDTIQASEFDTEIASIEGASKYAPRRISFYAYTGTELDEEISNLDTSNSTSMINMFYSCSNLTSLDLSSFNTSNVTNMSNMFYACRSLTELDLSSFDTTNVANMRGMFENCSKLTHLDIRNFDFTKVTSYTNMFNGVPTDCEIIVKDATAKNWMAICFTTLTNVKTVAELEASA